MSDIPKNYAMKNYFLVTLLLAIIVACGKHEKTSVRTWITHPSIDSTAYGVFHFRKSFDSKEIPDKLIINVSADNRYILFVNGERASYGPAKGDLQTYKYDVLDIAPYLRKGKNQIAALVYNAGKDKPMAMQSIRTGFYLSTEEDDFQHLNTNETWKVLKNEAYQPASYQEMLFDHRWFYGYYACGPGDKVDAELHPWGWELPDFDDSKWIAPKVLSPEESNAWKLVPRNIAFMDSFVEKPTEIRKADGAQGVDGTNADQVVTVPANSTATILYDYRTFTMGYPELSVAGGKGSDVKINYAEALYVEPNLKTHRDSVNGWSMFGVFDIFKPDGQERTFRPLWKRAFRYIQVQVTTSDEPLQIVSLQSEFSGYPYPELSTFESNDQELNKIFDMGIRTFRMCSGETYYDTPYYEQLSYGGDNRPIGALSMYNSTDDRLFREVMRLYPQSENPETGLFKSAYPSRFETDMGTWSMAWIQSLHDYYFVRDDAQFVSQFVDDIEKVLSYYDRHMDKSMNILDTIDTPNFIDWSITKGSIPRANENKEMINSILLTMYYAHTLDCTVKMYREIGEMEKANIWEQKSATVKAGVVEKAWNEELGLFSDYPGKISFSQHVNILAILCDLVDEDQQTKLLKRILEYDGFNEYASSYFTFFLFKALEKTGNEDLFFDQLGLWKRFISMGLHTVGETGFVTHDRSDCHAWSAHPSYYLLRMVCGIKPADKGFNNVLITPHLGDLTQVDASMPHAKGRIRVSYKTSESGKLEAIITLPEGMSGTWVYQGEEIALKSGTNTLK